MGQRVRGSKPAGSYYNHYDNSRYPPTHGWPRYARDEEIPHHLLVRPKGRRLPYQAQNAPEALPYLELIDDDDLDEIIEFNPSHPTIVWLRQKGWQ